MAMASSPRRSVDLQRLFGERLRRVAEEPCRRGGALALVHADHDVEDAVGEPLGGDAPIRLRRPRRMVRVTVIVADDVEALAQLLRWETRGAPATWPIAPTPPEIATYLDAAGVK